MAQLMTQAAYARHRGVTPPAVTGYKKAGLLVFAEADNGKMMVDVARSDARINAKVDPGRGRPPVAEDTAPALQLEAQRVDTGGDVAAGNETVAKVRMDLVRQQTIGARLKNAQAARELVPLAEAEQREAAVGRAARERVQAWFRGAAERLAAERDARAIMTLGEEGIDQVFAELAEAAEAGEFAEPDESDVELAEAAEAVEAVEDDEAAA